MDENFSDDYFKDCLFLHCKLVVLFVSDSFEVDWFHSLFTVFTWNDQSFSLTYQRAFSNFLLSFSELFPIWVFPLSVFTFMLLFTTSLILSFSFWFLPLTYHSTPMIFLSSFSYSWNESKWLDFGLSSIYLCSKILDLTLMLHQNLRLSSHHLCHKLRSLIGKAFKFIKNSLELQQMSLMEEKDHKSDWWLNCYSWTLFFSLHQVNEQLLWLSILLSELMASFMALAMGKLLLLMK